ncbi:hypothetical protein [Longimicrobium terrae]|uniref:C-terminal processing protease CtpA/Prc n=1 Tax=Longimicrobium terrae TaxID=1639882 RepID=A0A841GRD6_9BACT|nr:hypothetical protein [Longimicrobium terrae]MBB4635297.1 C-terminal processing protease CtpA/Prc [Longimicrobium terrae]MBB6069690.1 C-terminal processing protease CtpA/Prc [Longimicrobium terrae]NNC31099.1 hypothetical protein [Longimicrobium terrae]
MSILAPGLALLLLPAALVAQTAGPTPGGSRPGGCRGVNTESSSITGVWPGGKPVEFPSYPTVADVHKDSPAELAGMRRGDLIILQDGHDLVVDPPTQPSFAGDTVQLMVRRGDTEVPLTVVLGRWEPQSGEERVCVRVEPASSRS